VFPESSGDRRSSIDRVALLEAELALYYDRDYPRILSISASLLELPVPLLSALAALHIALAMRAFIPRDHDRRRVRQIARYYGIARQYLLSRRICST